MAPTDSHARPGATVVIVDWNEPEVTLEAVRSALEQDPAPAVIVVDNGSERTSDGHPAAGLDGVRVLRLPANAGFAGGANAGIAAASTDRVVLLNNDARMAPGALAALLAPLDVEGVGAVTALLLLDGDGEALVNSTGGEVTHSANGRDRDWRMPLRDLARPAGPTMAFSGGAVALSLAAVADAGGAFDERLFMYYEDTELSFRMRRRGWEIRYTPDAVVHHRHAYSSGAGSESFLARNERNRLRFAVVHGTGGVIARAGWRTLAGAASRLLRGDARGAGRRLRALGHAVAHLGELRRSRREVDRSATVARAAVWAGAPRD